MKLLTSPRGRLAVDRDTPRMSIGDQFMMFSGVFFPFAALVFAIVHYWGRGVGAWQMTMMLVMYSVTVIGITVGYHRLFTHRAFETGPVMRFLLAVAGSMALQGPVIQWVAVHRRHHQQSDREGDPHSPHLHGTGLVAQLKGMWHSHVGWLFEDDQPGINRSVTDLMGDPVVCFADRFFWWWVALGLIIPTVIGYAITRNWHGALSGFLWGGLIRMCLMHHATFSINSVCHVWGTRPYKSADESRNNLIFGIVSFGEGWHNNHHAFPTSARHGLKWWQLDISWLFIQLLKLFGQARNIRLPSQTAMNLKRVSDDDDDQKVAA